MKEQFDKFDIEGSEVRLELGRYYIPIFSDFYVAFKSPSTHEEVAKALLEMTPPSFALPQRKVS